jgi:predicted phosphodiesterase
MKIQVISDIHLEFHDSIPEILLDETFVKAPYLFLLGDIAIPKKHTTKWMKFMMHMASKYTKVFYLIGNHESYGYSIEKTASFIKDQLKLLDNVFYLEAGVTYELEDYTVVGCTLWTDIDLGTALLMNDINNIKTNDYKRLPVEKLKEWHQHDKTWLETILSSDKEKISKIIVATHHMPSMKLIHPRFQSPSDMKYARGFASPLDHLVKHANIWLFGHTHAYTDMMLENTRCYCNPMGYPNENTGFQIESIELE